MPVREEQVTTSKQTVDRGEVAVGKRQVQETKRVTDTVKREEAHIDRQGDVDVEGKDTEVEERTITVPIRREEIVIERRSVAAPPVPAVSTTSTDSTAPTTPAAGQMAQVREGRTVELAENETIRIPLYTEEVSIQKRPVVAEEVLVSKRGIQERRRFSDTVQREELRMEREGNVTVHGDAVEEVAPQEGQKVD